MGYHTVSLPTPVAVTEGQPFVVAVKVTSPGSTYPIPFEAPYANYSSAATAQAGQSYISSTGSSWTDVTTRVSNANVCLKAYVCPRTGAHGDRLRPDLGRRRHSVTVTGTGFRAPPRSPSTAPRRPSPWTPPPRSRPRCRPAPPPARSPSPLRGAPERARRASPSLPPASRITVTAPTDGTTWPSGTRQPRLHALRRGERRRVRRLDHQHAHRHLVRGRLQPPVAGQTALHAELLHGRHPGGHLHGRGLLPSRRRVWGNWAGQRLEPLRARRRSCRAPLSLTVTAPTAGTTWPSGSAAASASRLPRRSASAGFNAWLINTVTGTWYGAGSSPPSPARPSTRRASPRSASREGTYTAVVYYRPDAAVWGNWQANALSPVGAATITAPALSITMAPRPSAPPGPRRHRQPRLHALPAVSVGEFNAWLIDTVTGNWYAAGSSAPVAGRRSTRRASHGRHPARHLHGRGLLPSRRRRVGQLAGQRHEPLRGGDDTLSS